MRVVIVAVGKVKERGIRDAIDEYVDRVKRHLTIEEIEVRDAPPALLSPALKKRIPPAGYVAALDVSGKSRTSEGFARWLDERTREGKGIVVFLIGGADGLPRDILDLAHERMSLSTMTFPHRLARLILAEQLYRAGTISRGEPYARL